MLAYNHAPYIFQAIDSVLQQHTDFRFEVLIGDDASSDNTSCIVRDYAKRYPEIIVPVIRETNLGATNNLYDLIERASGKYLAYLECDDYWCDITKLQQQVDFLENNPEYIACTHKVAVIDQNGTVCDQNIEWICEKEEYSITDFKGIVLPGHISSIVHRNIFWNTKGQYKELITLHPMIADRSLSLLLAANGPIHQIQRVMGCYRQPVLSRNSATTTLYLNNPRRILDDYSLSVRLDEYAVQKLGIKVDFCPHEKDLLFCAVWAFLRKPNRWNFDVAVKMLWAEHSVESIKYVVYSIFKKIKDRLK